MSTIKDLEKISLSNIDMLELVNGKSNLLQYPDLAKASNIDEILGPYGCCIILFLTKESYGHWTCVFKVDANTLEHFDPYGIYPDEELNFKMNPYFRKESNQDYPHLSYLLYNSPYNLSFNQYQFQEKLNNVATCGRHVSMRIILRKLSLDDYKNLITSTVYSPDEVVTIITHSLLENK